MSRTASASRAIGLLVVLVAVSIPLSIATNVSAHHPKSPGSYLHSIRSVSQTEQYCVDDYYTTLSFATVLDRVRATLIVERTDVNWDMKQGGYTDFRTTWDYPCRSLNSSTTPTRAEIELEYHVQDTIQESACGGTSCAVHFGSTWSGPYGRTEYQYYNIYLRGSLISADGDVRRHVVNHETGHALGLADGYAPDCPSPASVMHPSYYGCGSTNVPWPSLGGDHPTVNQLIFGQAWP